MTSEELLDGYDVLFPANLRLAHEAVLTAAAELSDDGWPTPAMIVKWARCYDVPVVELAGLCGILVSKIGRRTVFSDERRHPELVNRLSATAAALSGFVAGSSRASAKKKPCKMRVRFDFVKSILKPPEASRSVIVPFLFCREGSIGARATVESSPPKSE